MSNSIGIVLVTIGGGVLALLWHICDHLFSILQELRKK